MADTEVFSHELTKGLDEIIEGLKETNEKLAELSFSNEEWGKLIELSDTLSDVSKKDARIITLDYSKGDEVSGFTVTDGTGMVVLDKDYIDMEAEKRNEEFAADIINSTKDAEVVVVSGKRDLSEINRAIREAREKKHLPLKDLASAWMKDRLISFSKASDTFENLVKRWNEPFFLQVFHAVSHEFSRRKLEQFQIHYRKEVYKNWLDKELERRAELNKLKDIKKEEKRADKIWRPLERNSKEYKALSRDEKLIEKELVLRFPANVPLFSTWEPLAGNAGDIHPPLQKATNREVMSVRKELLEKMNRERSEENLSWQVKKESMLSGTYEAPHKQKSRTRNRTR